MTIEKEVENYFETGTPFDYADFDFRKDEQDAQDDGKGGLMTLSPQLKQSVMPGETDIPARNQRYIDQRQQRFETYEMPTFEDES